MVVVHGVKRTKQPPCGIFLVISKEEKRIYRWQHICSEPAVVTNTTSAHNWTAKSSDTTPIQPYRDQNVQSYHVHKCKNTQKYLLNSTNNWKTSSIWQSPPTDCWIFGFFLSYRIHLCTLLEEINQKCLLVKASVSESMITQLTSITETDLLWLSYLGFCCGRTYEQK